MERYSTAIRLVLRIAAFCLAMGPIAFALKVIVDVVEMGSLRDAFSSYRAATILRGCVKVSALALPAVATLSIGMYLLGKLRRDSFLIAVGAGSVLVGVSIGLTIYVMVGPSPEIFFNEPYAWLGIAILVLVFGTFLSTLYWLFAVRRVRRRRLLAESDAQAIRAME